MKRATTDREVAGCLTAEDFRAKFRLDRPDIDPEPVVRAIRDFAAWRGGPEWPATPADRSEIATYLAQRSIEIGGRYAAANLAHLQIGAPVLWSVNHAAMIGMLLRSSRCAPKAPAKTMDEKARAAIERLPSDWQAGLRAKLGSEAGLAEKWSDHYVHAVATAMARWHEWSSTFGYDTRPCGVSFQAYAGDVTRDGVSERSAADYLMRIASGYLVAVDGGFYSRACDHVVARHRAQGKKAGRRTKTADQIVGASTIFDLGMRLVDRARSRGPRGLHAARDFRNGLLLAVAAALPQRARALSSLAFDSTLILLDAPYIRIALPGHVLKLPEARKARSRYDKVIGNPALWAALDEYRRLYRPLFDDGHALFPNVLDMGAGISSSQLGRLVGNITAKHLGVRVSIHRVRDNVATEASEEIRGRRIPRAGIARPQAARPRPEASYDHAEGVRAARDYGAHLASRRSVLGETAPVSRPAMAGRPSPQRAVIAHYSGRN